MITVIEAIRDDHRNMAKLLRALERQIDKFAGAERPDYDIIVSVTDYFADFPDRCHHPKEDVIFEKLRAGHPEAAATVSVLVDDHRALHGQLLHFRQAVSALLNGSDTPRSFVVGAARAFIAAQYEHMRNEEEAFLPLVEQTLTPPEWADIESRLDPRADPIFGPSLDEMYRSVRERLLAWQAEDVE